MRIQLFTAALAVLLPGTVLAQDACGIIGAEAPWIAGDAAGSDLPGRDTPLIETAEIPASGPLVRRFSVSTDTGARIAVDADGPGDPTIALYDAQGGLAGENDDAAGSSNSRLDLVLAQGDYCLVAREFSGETMMAQIRISAADPTEVTMAQASRGMDAVCTVDTPSIPLPITSRADAGVTVTASAAEAPFYRFTLSETVPLVLRADNDTADPILRLYDGASHLIGENDDFEGRSAQLSFPAGLAPGDYCLGLGALSNPGLPITLSATLFDPVAEARRGYANGEVSPPRDSDYRVDDLGALESVSQQDLVAVSDWRWFSFEMPAQGMVLIDGIGAGFVDPQIALFDAVGRPLGRDDDSGQDQNARLATPLQPGSYMVGIGRNGDGVGVMRLTLQRFVPAE